MAPEPARFGGAADVAALLLALVAVLTVALTPRGFAPIRPGWPLSWLQGAVAVGSLVWLWAVRIPIKALAIRWLAFAPLVALPALSLALASGFSAQAGREFLSQLLKGYACFTVVLALLHQLGFRRLLAALARLRVPAVLLSTLAFMERYREVLTDELHRARRARLARAFRPTWRQRIWQAGTLAGVTIVRAIERAERVHAAMIARGYDGRKL